MATQNAFGLRWLGFTISGAPGAIARYGKPSSDATAIYMGDVVMLASAVSVPDPEGGNPMRGIKSAVGNGTPGTGLWLGASLNYGAASSATAHMIIDDPAAVFQCQSDSAAVELISATVGKNANFALTAGNATTKQSGVVLHASTIATTSGLDMRIRGMLDDWQVNPDNAAYPVFEVEIVLHQFQNKATTGV